MINVLLSLIFFFAALLYSAVGQAGASGYLAIMALFAMPLEIMKPTALAINILVASIASLKYYRAGHFSWAVFWPFAMMSIPFSFVGGFISLPSYIYKPVVAAVLLYAAYRLLRVSLMHDVTKTTQVPLRTALICGAAIGLISGLTGIGGGIFLTPLLLFMNWAEPRTAAGVSAPFILVNSIAGLIGNFSSMGALPSSILIWGLAAGLGGYIGAAYGSRQTSNVILKRLLAPVLVIAGLKMIFI